MIARFNLFKFVGNINFSGLKLSYLFSGNEMHKFSKLIIDLKKIFKYFMVYFPNNKLSKINLLNYITGIPRYSISNIV